jgi:hypothetical protein
MKELFFLNNLSNIANLFTFIEILVIMLQVAYYFSAFHEW